MMDEFLVGYYGAEAAPHVSAFIHRMQAAARGSGEKLAMHTSKHTRNAAVACDFSPFLTDTQATDLLRVLSESVLTDCL